MNLDEFNLVCYASMYGFIQYALSYMHYNQGNFFEKYVSIKTVYLT